MRTKLLQSLGLGLAAALLALVGGRTGWLVDDLENAFWSWRVHALAAPAPSTDRVKLILIDQASLDWGAKESGLSWPWPREVYAPVLDFCRRSGARAVAFDMLYSEPAEQGPDQDEALGAAIRRTPGFVGAFFMGSQAAQTNHWPADLPYGGLAVDGLSAWLAPRAAWLVEPRATFPVSQVATSATLLASVKDVPDADGMFRRVTPFRVFDGRAVPSLGLAAWLAGQGSNAAVAVDAAGLHLGHVTVPLDARGRAILRFRGPSGTHQAVSAAAVIQSELRLLEGGVPVLDTNLLRGCYVFFGVSAPGLKDLKATPVSGDYPGVEIHATFLDNVLERDALRDAPAGLSMFLVVLLSILAAAAILFSRKAWQSAALIALFLPLPVAAGFAAYAAGWWWPVAAPEVGVALALAGAVLVNYATEGRQKRFIKSAFKQYLGGEVIEQIIADPSRLKLGGEKRELTMFFSDLEKFSSFSERLSPPQLIDLLNEYLTDMCAIIMEEGGYVDKFVGDAIVAFWNAPLPQPDHAARAARAALRCQRRLAERRDELAQKTGAVLKMRIGLNTGEVIVGNMGSRDRFNYTMLGDAANLASRLEGANKAFGTYMLVAESTWAQVGGALFGREVAALRVVGRAAPVRVYEALGLAGEAEPGWLPEYRSAAARFGEGKWQEALWLFESIPGDPVSQAYAEKCRALLDGSLKEWAGVWNLTEK